MEPSPLGFLQSSVLFHAHLMNVCVLVLGLPPSTPQGYHKGIITASNSPCIFLEGGSFEQFVSMRGNNPIRRQVAAVLELESSSSAAQ